MASMPYRCLAGRRSGFTLIEMLVALAIMGVAASIFISLYTNSLDLARKARNETVAVSLAEAKLAALARTPDRFLWDYNNRDSQGRIPIRLGAEDPPAGNLFDLPAAMPAETAAHEREVNLFKLFRWSAFAERAPGAGHYVVVLVVRWQEAGRERSIALTSALPASQVTWVPEEDTDDPAGTVPPAEAAA